MTEYVVLIPGDEATWAAATEEQKRAMYDRHNAFAAMLEERGHRVTGGAELRPAATAKIVRQTEGRTLVTDGPYAETAEQLTGFYTVQSDDLDDLLEVVAFLAGAEGALEVRATVDHSVGSA
ncbi:MAG: YciI family protein [Nocardioides sp.]